MTRKDYIKLAGAIRHVAMQTTTDTSPWWVLSAIRTEIGNVLQIDNVNFDRNRFEAATTSSE